MQKPLARVGRYEIVREIGRGGMAVVYLARQIELERFVALKELAVLQATDPTFAQRFLREARLAGSLNNPNVVTVHEYFEDDGVPYLSMEYLERGSLRPYVKDGLTLQQVIGALEGVLAGLAHAETRGIVHRDLKPENLMVTSEGGTKIADFGIAKALDRAAGGDFKTATGLIAGTPAYMAPEQAMGGDIGPWTDIYSLGIIAYELFAARVPFEEGDESPVVVLLRHVNQSLPSLQEVRPDLDPRIVAWVERVLAKNQKERPQSARQAWEELEDVVLDLLGPMWRRDARLPAPGVDTSAPPLTPAFFDARATTPASAEATTAEPVARPARRRFASLPRPLLWGLPVLLALLAAAAVLAVVIGGDSSSVDVRWRFEAGGLESSSPALSGGAAFFGARNGGLFAFDAKTGDQLGRVETGPIAFSSPAVAGGRVFIGSEDQHVYAFNLDTQKRLWRFKTGKPVHSSPTVYGGVVFIGSDDGVLYALLADTGEEHWRFKTDGPIQSTPAVSDDVVYFASRNNSVYALDVDTGEERWQYETGGEVWSSPAVAAGTVYIGSSDGGLYALRAATGEFRWRFETGSFVSSSPAVSGGTVFVGSFDHNVFAVDARTGKERWSYETGGNIFSSPAVGDGVVYVGSHDHKLYALDAATGVERWSFEAGELIGSSPAVSDGTVYFASDDGNFYAVRG